MNILDCRIPAQYRFMGGVFTFVLVLSLSTAPAQAANPEAELSRLEQQADESIANGDPTGAAAWMGRAALKASLFARQQDDSRHQGFYEGLESLFRAQENAYRAFGLFQQSGGRPPASSGVCQTLALAKQFAQKAGRQFQAMTVPATPEDRKRYDRYRQDTDQWTVTIEEMKGDFECL